MRQFPGYISLADEGGGGQHADIPGVRRKGPLMLSLIGSPLVAKVS